MNTQSQTRRQFRRRPFGLRALMGWLVALDGQYRQAQAYKRLTAEARKDMGLPEGEGSKAPVLRDAQW